MATDKALTLSSRPASAALSSRHPGYTGMPREEIRRLRIRLGLSQHGMAQRLGTTVTTVSRWETGLRRPTGMYLRALEKLAAKVA